MKMMKAMTKRAALPLLLAALLASCTLRPADEYETGMAGDPGEIRDPSGPTETVGEDPPETAEPLFGWETEPETMSSGPEETDAPEPVPEGEHPTIRSGRLWKYENGTFVYDFPARDTSRVYPLESMYDIPNVPFDDVGYDAEGNPNTQDWYPGKMSYDESTGESTVLWERSASTLVSVATHHAIYRGDTGRKVVYFTFDSGFETGTTASILDTLKEKHVPATFFINGWYVESAPDMVRRMLDEGHILANHALNHDMLTEATLQSFYDEVTKLEEAYRAAFPDAPDMLYFRPPSENCNDWVLAYAEKLGYTTVLHSWAYRDWVVEDQPDVEESLAKLKENLHPGCVYLFHTVSETNTKMIPLAIDWIREQGYEIIPLCDIDP